MYVCDGGYKEIRQALSLIYPGFVVPEVDPAVVTFAASTLPASVFWHLPGIRLWAIGLIRVVPAGAVLQPLRRWSKELRLCESV